VSIFFRYSNGMDATVKKLHNDSQRGCNSCRGLHRMPTAVARRRHVGRL